MKKIVSVFIATVMLFVMSTSVFAADGRATRVTEVNGVRTVTSYENDSKYTIVYDKINNTISVTKENLATGETVTSGIRQIPSGVPEKQASVNSTSNTIHQDTFLNFEYDIYLGSPNEWSVERPTGFLDQYYFMTYENGSNVYTLSTYRRYVDTLNDQEWRVIWSCGAVVFDTVRTAVLAIADINSGGVISDELTASIVFMVDSIGNAADEIRYLCQCYNDCSRQYDLIWRTTDNFHY